jgi:hypothetical protein
VSALSTYLLRTRRLLTDPNAQYWSDTELTDDINQARNRVCADTKCLRQLFTGITLATGVEQYNIATTVSSSTGTPNLGLYVVEVIGVTIYWGNMRVKCRNLPFTEQDAKLRIFQTYQTRPGSVAMIGGNTVYINPMPDQAYVSDWDCAIIPIPLVDNTSLEVIPVVWQNLVSFYAAHLAKYGEQSLSESDIFYKKYLTERQAGAFAQLGARYRDAYRR